MTEKDERVDQMFEEAQKNIENTEEQRLNQILGEVQKNNASNTQRRSLINPMFWIGACVYLLGFLFCITIIGIPIGGALIIGGKNWMYKNTNGWI